MVHLVYLTYRVVQNIAGAFKASIYGFSSKNGGLRLRGERKITYDFSSYKVNFWLFKLFAIYDKHSYNQLI